MKVLHICETIKGGVATYLNTFSQVCADRTENTFLVPEDHVDQLTTSEKIVCFQHKGRGLKTIWALARVAYSEAVRIRPDVLFFHSTFSLGALALLRARKVPGSYIYCPHAWAQSRYTESPTKARVVSAIEGRLAGLPDMVLNISHNDREMALYHGYRGSHVVVENALPDLPTNPLSLPSPIAVSSGRINLLFVGRFDRQKGLDILLEAFALAQKTNPEIHLHVVGANVQDSADVTAATLTGITFHSWVPADRIADFYRFADMVVMPSRWEGLPMVLIEALRAGTPILLSNASGMAKLIEDGHSGLVVRPEPAALARTIESLTRESVSAMRPAARQLYESRYSGERFRKETLEALSHAISVSSR